MAEQQAPQQQPQQRGPPKMKQGHMLLLMDDILQKLRLLNYENRFLKENGLKPLTEAYFTIPKNANEQFNYFKLLVSWLFELNDSSQGDYANYDDPMSVASNIQFELKKMGIDCDFPAVKLKSGAGEQVCVVLQKLINKTLKSQRFQFKKPKFPKEKEANVEETIEDDEEDKEGIDDDIIGGDSDDELSEGFDMANEVGADEDKFAREIMYTRIEEKDWKIECERALSHLKVRVRHGGKEWRNHIEKTKKYLKDIKKIMPNAQAALQKKTDSLAKVLETISRRERAINEKMSQNGIEYQDQAQEERQIQNAYDMQAQKKKDLEERLRQITERLDDVQSRVDQSGNTVTDSSPVVKIKNAIERLQKEIQEMDVRIGILRHNVMQYKYKEKRYNFELGVGGLQEQEVGLGLEEL